MNHIVDGIIRKVYSSQKRVTVDMIPVIEPNPGDVCFITDEENLIPIRIIDGQLYGRHGFSNVWTWENLFTGERESGYGGFFTVQLVKTDDAED